MAHTAARRVHGLAMNSATALWQEAPGRVALRSQALAAPGQGQVLVRTRYSGISRGTESLVLAGQVPASEYSRMRAPFQQGQFPFPVKYGYACVGVVEAGEPALLGQEVFCLHPHQDRFVVDATQVAVLPPGVPAARAVLAANAETALNIVWDARIGPGDRVAVVGAGVVGALTAYLAAAIPATEVTLVDIDLSRQRLARALGLGFAVPDHAPRGCDAVIHASASAAGLASALDCAGFEARVVEARWYGEKAATLRLGGAFHSQRLHLVSSQVGQLPAERRARWSHARRLQTALSLLGDARLEALISGQTPFSQAAADYPRVLADAATLCHRFAYFP